MMNHASLTAARSPGLRWKIALCLSLILISLLSGCAARQLSSFKKHAAAADFQWIADQQVDCAKVSEVCGQLHLLRGDACFRLAKAAAHAADDYACAADELEKGLALNPAWKDAAVQRRYRENLCESLRNLQDLQSGDAAARTLDRFVTAAERLHQLAPDSVAAVFYLAKARLRQVQPMLIDIDAASLGSVCNRLKHAAADVRSTIEAANHATLPEWNRFAESFQQLSFELGATMQAAQCP